MNQKNIISKLTLEEKIAMIHAAGLFRSGAVKRLNIPSLVMSDGPSGVRQEFENDSWTPIDDTTDFVSWLPSNTCLCTTWNPNLAHKFGEVLGNEARGRGKDVILAPGINIKRMADLVYYLIEECRQRKLNIALPSLRIDAFSLDVMSKVQDIRKSSLTFAPEAGSQRMRDVINKGLTKDVILKGAWEAFQGGWKRVKLYFMLGLPGETDEDIAAIAELANDIAATYFELPKEERQGRPEITASTSFFVPKPFTPFQWAPMGTAEYFDEKRRFLTGKVREQINQRSIRYICHDAVTSELEGIFARGDSKLSDVIEKAYKKGCIFDAWTDYFRPDVWNELLDELSVDRDFYNYRERNEDEIFPWDFIDIGVSKQFLRREYENAKQGKVTPNCKQKCSGCGAASFHAGICMMDRKASGGSAQ